MDSNFYDKTYYYRADSDPNIDNLHPAKIRENKFLKNLICPKTNESLLDVGCGTGVYLSMLKDTGADLWGIDISKNATNVAKRRMSKPENIICVDAAKMPFSEDKFDYVTAWGVIEHFPDISAALREIKRVAKKDGKIAIMVPNLFYYKFVWDALRRGKGPVRHQDIESLYSFTEWKDLLEKEDLRIIKVSRHNKFNKSLIISLLKHFIPFYFSNHFIFICQK